MRLDEVLDLWRAALLEGGEDGEGGDDDFIFIDAQSVPGWVIALRRGPEPYVEIWWEEDFLEEVRTRPSGLRARVEPTLEGSTN